MAQCWTTLVPNKVWASSSHLTLAGLNKWPHAKANAILVFIDRHRPIVNIINFFCQTSNVIRHPRMESNARERHQLNGKSATQSEKNGEVLKTETIRRQTRKTWHTNTIGKKKKRWPYSTKILKKLNSWQNQNYTNHTAGHNETYVRR